jgi:hypothetical protein
VAQKDEQDRRLVDEIEQRSAGLGVEFAQCVREIQLLLCTERARSHAIHSNPTGSVD